MFILRDGATFKGEGLGLRFSGEEEDNADIFHTVHTGVCVCVSWLHF